MASMIVTTPYTEIKNLVNEAASELGIEIIVVEEILENAVGVVKEIVNKSSKKIEIIISRGGTAQSLRKEIELPLILIEWTDFDILQALWEVKDLTTNKIGFICYEEFKYDYDIGYFEKILDAKVIQYTYTKRQDIAEQVEKAYIDGVQAIVGGGEYGVTIAQAYGIRGGLIPSSKRSIVQALRRAQAMLDVILKERANEELLKNIINFAYEGIIAFNNQGKVMLFNPVAEKLFKVESSKAINLSTDELVSITDCTELFKTQEKELQHKIWQIGEYDLLVNRIPITINSEDYGQIYTFHDISRIQKLEQLVRKEVYKKGLVTKFTSKDIIAESKVMKELLQKAHKYGATDSTVLITGESGTGKELVAQSLHQFSTRSDGPFVAVNCAALPENLLESELFGYEEGAFTGAKKGGKRGLFELAHGGTIFLDEIGSIALNLQARLLRVLQEKEVRRIGADRIIPINVRVVAATNIDLRKLIKEEKFRSDLYFRLNVLNLRIPSLIERKEDIPHLVKHFLEIYNKKFNKQIQTLETEIWQKILNYNWPGNVRELENVIQRCVLNADDSVVYTKDLENIFENEVLIHDQIKNKPSGNQLLLDQKNLAEIELEVIQQMSKVIKNQTQLAKILGVSRTTLWKKLREIGREL